jgi:hypothetical protein
VSNYISIQKLKKRYFFEYAFSVKIIRRILPSLVIISSTNNYYYAFHESSILGIPSVGFIDSDLEFLDSFYPILGNNDNKASDFFLIISFSCVSKNALLRKRLYFFLIKIKYLWFCLRFYIYIKFLKKNQIGLLYESFYSILVKNIHIFSFENYKVFDKTNYTLKNKYVSVKENA